MADLHVRRGDTVLGPFPPDKIKQMIADGKIRQNDLIRVEGDDQWNSIADIPNLAKLFGSDNPSTAGRKKSSGTDSASSDPQKMFVKRGDAVRGPLTMKAVLDGIAAGKIGRADQIGPRNTGPWKEAGSLSQLFPNIWRARNVFEELVGPVSTSDLIQQYSRGFLGPVSQVHRADGGTTHEVMNSPWIQLFSVPHLKELAEAADKKALTQQVPIRISRAVRQANKQEQKRRGIRENIDQGSLENVLARFTEMKCFIDSVEQDADESSVLHAEYSIFDPDFYWAHIMPEESQVRAKEYWRILYGVENSKYISAAEPNRADLHTAQEFNKMRKSGEYRWYCTARFAPLATRFFRLGLMETIRDLVNDNADRLEKIEAIRQREARTRQQRQATTALMAGVWWDMYG